MQNQDGKHAKTIGEQWHEQAVRHSTRDSVAMFLTGVAVFMVVTLLAIVMGIVTGSQSQAHAGEADPEVFADVPSDVIRQFDDVAEHEAQKRYSKALIEQYALMEQQLQAEAEAAVAAEAEASYWYYDESLNNNPAYSGAVRGNANGLNSFDGVYEFNGKTETYYSNSAVYDDQLWVDDDGFWRTDDGHYVVASVDYPEGTEIEISQGKAIVMDGGNEPGNVDVHTTW